MRDLIIGKSKPEDVVVDRVGEPLLGKVKAVEGLSLDLHLSVLKEQGRSSVAVVDLPRQPSLNWAPGHLHADHAPGYQLGDRLVEGVVVRQIDGCHRRGFEQPLQLIHDVLPCGWISIGLLDEHLLGDEEPRRVAVPGFLVDGLEDGADECWRVLLRFRDPDSLKRHTVITAAGSGRASWRLHRPGRCCWSSI